jgi:hypothetical protein
LSDSSLSTPLLDGLRGLVDERFGLLRPEAGRRADDLDDLDILLAGAQEHDVERALLLLWSAVAVTPPPPPEGAAAAIAVAEPRPNATR